MIFGILFPPVPTGSEWAKLPTEVKAQWILLGCFQITGIAFAMLIALFAL